jgi:hypothetical protein
MYAAWIILCTFLGAVAGTFVPTDAIDPDITCFAGAIGGQLLGATVGGFIFGILVCEIIREEIRKTRGNDRINSAMQVADPPMRGGGVGTTIGRWSWIGCGGGLVGGGIVGALTCGVVGVIGGGPMGALAGVGIGMVGGGDVGCLQGGLAAARHLPAGASGSWQFSYGFWRGAGGVPLVTLVVAVVILAVMQIVSLLGGGIH